ncbi:MAG: hypothetical protein AAF936_18505 [Pseudomonadota bacterium]
MTEKINLKDFLNREYDVNGVFVFDFDGVLSSPDEHRVYEPESLAKSDNLLNEACEAWKINSDGVDTKYIRHLAFQHALRLNHVHIKPGPCLDLARHVSKTARIIILTARSGWSAVERVRLFLKYHDINVYEMMCVGRGKKIQQFDDITREAASASLPVYFFEDNDSHLDDIEARAGELACEVTPVFVASKPKARDWEKVVDEFCFLQIKAALMAVHHAGDVALVDKDLTEPLKHARDLFIYHAGQRHTSIRYFLLAFAAVATVYMTLLGNEGLNQQVKGIALLVIGIVGFIFTRFFNKLDSRNGRIVEADEAALKELEANIAERHKLSRFEIMAYAEVISPDNEQYKAIIPKFLYGIMAVFGFGVIVGVLTIFPVILDWLYSAFATQQANTSPPLLPGMSNF